MTSPFPSGSMSPDTTPWSSSAILPDSAIFFNEEGTHSSLESRGTAAVVGEAGTRARKRSARPRPGGGGLRGGRARGLLTLPRREDRWRPDRRLHPENLLRYVGGQVAQPEDDIVHRGGRNET